MLYWFIYFLSIETLGINIKTLEMLDKFSPYKLNPQLVELHPKWIARNL